MLWHEKLDELSAEIIPGNAARLISDLEDAATWRQLLSAKGRADNIERLVAEYRTATLPKREVVDSAPQRDGNMPRNYERTLSRGKLSRWPFSLPAWEPDLPSRVFSIPTWRRPSAYGSHWD